VKEQLLPAEVIERWPEILEDIVVSAIPLAYLHSLKIFFKNGKIWELPITAKCKKEDIVSLTRSIEDLLREYEHSIESMDFQIDIARVKKDSIRITNKFFKVKK
jgi:hypothetical protein